MGRLAGGRQGPGEACGARSLRRRQPVLTLHIGAGEFWQAWFDGSALPNPGKIGLGVVLLAPDGRCTEKSLSTAFHGCNNEAELHALCAALEMAATAGARRLRLHGDSDVAISYVRGPCTTQVERLQRLVAAAQTALEGFDEVQLLWLPRHRNTAADALSRLALGLPAAPAKSAAARRRRR